MRQSTEPVRRSYLDPPTFNTFELLLTSGIDSGARSRSGMIHTGSPGTGVHAAPICKFLHQAARGAALRMAFQINRSRPIGPKIRNERNKWAER
jgi:hypothetical protein